MTVIKPEVEPGDEDPGPSDSISPINNEESSVSEALKHLPLANNVQKCTTSFFSVLSNLSPSFGAPGGLTPTDWTDEKIMAFTSGVAKEFDRYTIWSVNMGTYENGHSSLDYRLRDASNVSKQVCSLVNDLIETLQDSLKIINGDKEPWNQISDENRTINDDEVEDENFDFDTELEQSLADIENIVDCLYRLSSVISDPSPHDRLILAPRTNVMIELSSDIQHIKSIIPKADEELIRRLGKANFQRRIYFSSRKAQHDPPRTDPNIGKDVALKSSNFPPTSTVAFSEAIFLKAKYYTQQDDQALEESNANVELTHTALQPGAAGTSGTQEPSSEGLSLSRCPFCWAIVCINDWFEWKKHIFTDLRPYICIEAKCRDSERLFESQYRWIQHVRRSHWMNWQCAAGCSTSSTSKEDLAHHLETHHADLTPTHLESLIALSERPGLGFRELECPLCLQRLTTGCQYQEHIRRHQEWIALFTLPTEYNYEDKYSETTSQGSEEPWTTQQYLHGVRVGWMLH
ncbi:hypothetical protein BJ166DRAFT_532966 [Pestalotiopsis sp. NC0098]|nr:hypothetical protein BJ166DRAFT_532966 [Pestalotiopsis sp. NC0098]